MKRDIDEKKLRDIFEELEFRTLAQRILPTENSEKKTKNYSYQTNLFAEFEEKDSEEKNIQLSAT